MAKFRAFSCLSCGMHFHSHDRYRRHATRHLRKYSYRKSNMRYSRRVLNGVYRRTNDLRRKTCLKKEEHVDKKKTVVKHTADQKGVKQETCTTFNGYNSLPHLQPLHHISAMPGKFQPPLAAARPFGMMMPRFHPQFMLRGHGIPLGFGPMGIRTPFHALRGPHDVRTAAILNGYDQLAFKQDPTGNLLPFPQFTTKLTDQGMGGPIHTKQVSRSTGKVNGVNSHPLNLDAPLDLSNKWKDVQVDTIAVASQLTNELRRYSIPQAVFARVVLKRTQGTLSDLLRNPKPWSKLKSGRETFRRMAEWLAQPEYERMLALKEAAQQCQNQQENNGKDHGHGLAALLPQSPSSHLDVKHSALGNLPGAHQIKLEGNSISSLSPISISPKRQASKKPRLVFTTFQKRTLYEIFKDNKRPPKEVQQNVADHLDLELSTVQNFFMNARRRSTEKWQDECGDDPQPSLPELNHSHASQPEVRVISSHEEDVLIKCELCDKTFRRQSNLTKHLRIHGKIAKKPCNIVQCEICKKVFSCSGNLTRHLQVHNREMKSSPAENIHCPYCMKPFPDEVHLALHIKTHMSVKVASHQCQYCDKSFTRSNTLNRHVRNVHRTLIEGRASMVCN